MNEARYRDCEDAMWRSVGVVPTERWVRLPAAGIDVRVQEVGEGDPVLFVHGATNSGTSWANLVAEMSGFRCLLLDRPGCGLSQPLGRTFTTVDAFASFADGLIVDVLDGLGLERAAVLSTSYGGYFGLRGAAAHPDRISRLFELSWALGAPIETFPFVMRFAAVPGVGKVTMRIPPTKGAVRAMLRTIGLRDALAAGRVSDELIASFQSLLRDTDTMRNELSTTTRVMTFRGFDPGVLLTDELLGSIRVPVFFLWGKNDPMGGTDVATDLAAKVPGAVLEMMPGGHAPWIDDPAHVASVGARFLGTDSATT